MVEEDLFNGPPTPSNFSYGFAKRCMAAHKDSYVKQYGKKWSYLIPCNLYGEFDKFDAIEGHFVGALINKIIKAKKKNERYINLFGDGRPKRQFMHAEDLAKVINMIVKNNISDSFNVATLENYSVKKIAKIALEVCDFKNAKIHFIKSMPNGQMRKDIDIKKFNRIFPNFNPILLKDGIREIYLKKMKEV